MNAIWSRQAKYERWLEVELAITDAHAVLGHLPMSAAQDVRARATFTLERCDEIEQETRHDLMAFVRCVSENVGENGRYVHMGVTSYDVIDTALGLMLRDSGKVLLQSAQALRNEIVRLAKEHADTPCIEIGRAHV